MVDKKRGGKKAFGMSGYVSDNRGRFLLQALIFIAFGLICLFSAAEILKLLTAIMAVGLIGFGVFELIRAFMLRRNEQPFGLSVISGGLSTILGFWLLVNQDARIGLLTAIVAIIVIVRGLFDIGIAMRGVKGANDKFIWYASGIIGVGLGIVILLSPTFGWHITNAFVWIFGIYLLVKGLSSAFYALNIGSAKAKAKKSSKK